MPDLAVYFLGNAIADWSGSVVIILGTKFLYEVGSAESRPVRGKERPAWLNTLHRHSLLIFIIVTGIGWAILFLRMNVDSKWGQVVGNIVSEWVQMAGLVFLHQTIGGDWLKRKSLNRFCEGCASDRFTSNIVPHAGLDRAQV